MSKKDQSLWNHPYDRMSEMEREEERRRLEDWRKTSEPSPSWFIPLKEDRERD